MGAKPLIFGEIIIGVDFDGTITTNPDVTDDPLELQPECYRVLHRLYNDGARLILWTCRTSVSLDKALAFLEDQDLIQVFDKVNDHIQEVLDKYSPYVSRKIGFDVSLDDKNLGSSYMKVNPITGKTYADWLEIERLIYGE